MEPASLAIFTSNDILPTNADGTMPFIQNRDLLYLSGIDQEESMLVIFPDAFDEKHREILFIRETNDKIAIWEGAKLSQEQATAISGIETVVWNDQFDTLMKNLMSQASKVYLNSNEHLRANVEIKTREDRLAEKVKSDYPLHTILRSAPIMHQLRAVKQEEEMVLMRRSSEINTDAFKRVMKVMKAGMMEYELEAEFIHEFVRNGSTGFSYTPIIAGGYNACVLHYIDNDAELKDGDLVLFDVGCWYGNYASDVTRCFPVNGRFTDRQKEVYEAVLRVQKASIEMLRPGNQLHAYHKEVGQLMEAELLNLGLISKKDIENQNPDWPAYKKYFMHGTSHYIGLDVHDVGLWTSKMEVGNVFTVEPGIYIPEENLGIRIEDDILITADGHENLTIGIPKEIDDIEAYMNS
jgi:Xaa-Pro aminopeptidase